MGLILLLAEKQKKSLSLVILLSIASAFLSVGVIAFIQHKLLESSGSLSDTLIQFTLLLIGLLVTATVAQVALHKLGHKFVYNKRCELVSQLLNTDIEQVEKVGSAGVLASLNTDIRNITIGLNFYLATGLGWATLEVASTFALVVLFMRTPLMSAVGSIPTLITANISMKKLSSLELSTDRSLNPKPAKTKVFNSLELVGASYRYRSDSDGDAFGVGPINFKIERGEHIFIIGGNGNGSGKSTFARLLTGLYRPHSGQVYVDGNEVTRAHWQDYRHQFSAVFSDFHLFHQIVDGEGQDIDNKDIDEWMVRLEMAHKVDHQQGKLSDVRYSQGQRKRLALMMSVLEKRGCILLDEWAADQDPRFRKLFYRQLLPLLKQRGVTVIAITHDDAYFDAADRIFKMDTDNLIELSKGNLAQAHQALESVVA